MPYQASVTFKALALGLVAPVLLCGSLLADPHTVAAERAKQKEELKAQREQKVKKAQQQATEKEHQTAAVANEVVATHSQAMQDRIDAYNAAQTESPEQQAAAAAAKSKSSK